MIRRYHADPQKQVFRYAKKVHGITIHSQYLHCFRRDRSVNRGKSASIDAQQSNSQQRGQRFDVTGALGAEHVPGSGQHAQAWAGSFVDSTDTQLVDLDGQYCSRDALGIQWIGLADAAPGFLVAGWRFGDRVCGLGDGAGEHRPV